MKLPTTKQGCVEKYNLRRQMYIPMTKLDMYLGGMICCSKEEFLYRNSQHLDGEIIGGAGPCLCIGKDSDWCGVLNCVDAMDKTLRLPWDAPLYEVKLYEMEERYDD